MVMSSCRHSILSVSLLNVYWYALVLSYSYYVITNSSIMFFFNWCTSTKIGDKFYIEIIKANDSWVLSYGIMPNRLVESHWKDFEHGIAILYYKL